MENKALKFWKIFAIVLLALNVILLLNLFSERFDCRGRLHRRGENPGAYLGKKLAFTDHQKAEFDKLREDHHSSMMKLHADGMKLRREFFDGIKDDQIRKEKQDSLVNLIAGNQRQIEDITFAHFRKIRELCIPKQKLIFDDIFQDAIQHICRPGPNPPGPMPE